jgi:hypothetical protein
LSQVSAHGGEVRRLVYLGVAFIAGRMTEAGIDVFSVGQPFPAALRRQLINAVAARAAAL